MNRFNNLPFHDGQDNRFLPFLAGVALTAPLWLGAGRPNCPNCFVPVPVAPFPPQPFPQPFPQPYPLPTPYPYNYPLPSPVPQSSPNIGFNFSGTGYPMQPNVPFNAPGAPFNTQGTGFPISNPGFVTTTPFGSPQSGITREYY